MLTSSEQRRLSGAKAAKAKQRAKGTKKDKTEKGHKEKAPKEPKVKKASLVDDTEKGRLKKFLGLQMGSFCQDIWRTISVFVHFLLYFQYIYIYICLYTPSCPRIMVHSDDFQIVPYWTTGQVAVKDKKKRKQIWTTSATTPASFEDKFHLANAVVTCLFFPLFLNICLRIGQNSPCSRFFHTWNISNFFLYDCLAVVRFNMRPWNRTSERRTWIALWATSWQIGP